jgi:hypothetical protein
VIREFRERHQTLFDEHRESREKGLNTEFRRYKLDHLNMHSAPVN